MAEKSGQAQYKTELIELQLHVTLWGQCCVLWFTTSIFLLPGFLSFEKKKLGAINYHLRVFYMRQVRGDTFWITLMDAAGDFSSSLPPRSCRNFFAILCHAHT